MKYLLLLEDWVKKEEKPNRLKSETYMFRDIRTDDKGNIKGVCKFCEASGVNAEVDLAEHTNNCPNFKK